MYADQIQVMEVRCPTCGHVPEEGIEVPLGGIQRTFVCSECGTRYELEFQVSIYTVTD